MWPRCWECHTERQSLPVELVSEAVSEKRLEMGYDVRP